MWVRGTRRTYGGRAMGSNFISSLRLNAGDVTILVALAILLGAFSDSQSKAAGVQTASAKTEMLLCDPFLTGCNGLISLLAPKATEADWTWDAKEGGPPPMDEDAALTTNPDDLVIVYIEDDEQYIGPLTQSEAMAYVDSGADYIPEHDQRYAG